MESMKLMRFTLAIVAVAALAACRSESDLGPVRDVSYYDAHEDQRTETLEKCRANPGQLSRHENCVNASKSHKNRLYGGKNTPSEPMDVLGL